MVRFELMSPYAIGAYVVALLLGLLGLTLVYRSLFRRTASDLQSAIEGLAGLVVMIAGGATALKIPPMFHLDIESPISCLDNAKQIGKSLLMYMGDNDDRVPPGNCWVDATMDYTGNTELYRCPELWTSPYGYWLNESVSTKLLVPGSGALERCVLAFDGPGGKDEAGNVADVRYRHDNCATLIFADFHARQETKVDVGRNDWRASSR